MSFVFVHKKKNITQIEDAEISHEDDVTDEDIPPVYEAVVNKYPSSEYLCGRGWMTLGGDEGGRHQKQEPHTDEDLPTYSEATETR